MTLPLIDFECPACKGSGTLLDPTTGKRDMCPKCDGTLLIRIDPERLTHHCWQCDGTGLRNGGPKLCPICLGDGYDRPGQPTGPGRAHTPLPGLRSGSSGLTGDVSIQVPTAHLTVTGYPPNVEVQEASKERFANAPKAVIADAEKALAVTIALEDILQNARSNSEEASEAITLLQRQRTVLGEVISVLKSGGDEKVARKSAVELLNELMASILKNWAEDGPVRGILAVAALGLASVLGVNLDWSTQLLITGSFVGKEVIDALRGWGKGGDENRDA